MAQNEFSSDHFKLLNKWQGVVYDATNPEQQRVYEELGKAYDVTKRWAEAVQQHLFKEGRTKVVRKPTDQWQKKFIRYNWARIYPSQNAPEGLAYTVGISAEHGFVVKIDLVDSKLDDASLRKKYELIRGPYTESPIVAIKPAEEGLALDFADLVEWSVAAIKGFKPTYDETAAQLGLSAESSQNSVLSHFQGHPDFTKLQPFWTATITGLFGRFARAVNEMGLDWWLTGAGNSQLRFGRKEKGAIKGSPVGWIHLRRDGFRVSWSAFAGLDKLEPADISSDLVQVFEDADKDEGSWPEKLGPRSGRNAYWPDDYDMEEEPITEVPPKNTIFYGPPGTGKTYELQRLLKAEYTDSEYGDRYEFATFHQSYGYEEFVEGLRPVITKQGKRRSADADPGASANGEIRYEIKPGAFLRLCEQARKNPSRKYAMVIDEINRGNISKIFGELITLIEVDKREGAKSAVEVKLAYSGEGFSVPANVDVIGTMNTADRSLALVDTALRRRFEFVELQPDASVLKEIDVPKDGTAIDIVRLLTVINDRIEALYDRDHTIGHAYFTQLRDLSANERFSALQVVFKNKIIPLLEEYFFEDWHKIALVLGDNQKGDRALQFMHVAKGEGNSVDLFGQDHELDQYSIRSRYRLNLPAFDDPEAYVGVYAPKAGLAGPA